MKASQLPPEDTTQSATELDIHTRRDPHHRASALSDVILGGQDGLVNVLGIILGMAAATGDARLVLVAGLAATFAESVSMGAVAYTSTLADADFYESERAREYRHLQSAPALEPQEIRSIDARKGFKGELLERIVDTITRDKDVWVAVMMADEHRLAPVNRRTALRSGLIVGVAAIVGSLVPLVPFVVLPVQAGMWAAFIAASGCCLWWAHTRRASRWATRAGAGWRWQSSARRARWWGTWLARCLKYRQRAEGGRRDLHHKCDRSKFGEV